MKIPRGHLSRAAMLAPIAFAFSACVTDPLYLSASEPRPYRAPPSQFMPPRESARAEPAPYFEDTTYREAAPRAASDDFTGIARELLTGLGADKRIALQPYVASDVPVPLAVAQSFNDSLARAIEKSASGNVIVARGELPRLLAETEEFAQTADQVALLEASRADVLLMTAARTHRTNIWPPGDMPIPYRESTSANQRRPPAPVGDHHYLINVGDNCGTCLWRFVRWVTGPLSLGLAPA